MSPERRVSKERNVWKPRGVSSRVAARWTVMTVLLATACAKVGRGVESDSAIADGPAGGAGGTGGFAGRPGDDGGAGGAGGMMPAPWGGQSIDPKASANASTMFGSTET